MKITFPLQEVIEDIVNTEKSLSTALMKLAYFGRQIDNQELINYTNKELNGYAPDDDIPKYRRAAGTLRITIQAYPERHFGILPASMLEEPYNEVFQYLKVREGIASIEKLAKEISEEDSGEIGVTFPMEMLHILQEPARKLYKSNTRIDVIAASVNANKNIVVAIPNAIRTKLLDFVMNIAKEFGYSIEIETFNENSEANNQTINNYMSTTINNTGDGNLINTGDHNQIDNKVQINKGDLAKLQDELRGHGIDEVDIQEITTIIAEEQPDIENDRLGPKANNWISGILNKSLNGIGKIGTAITANLLASLIKAYFGMGA